VCRRRDAARSNPTPIRQPEGSASCREGQEEFPQVLKRMESRPLLSGPDLRPPKRRPFPAASLAGLLCLVLVTALPEQAYSQTPDFDTLATRLAGAIVLLSRGLVVKPSVVVTDFAETHGGSNAMGAELARQFSKSLAKYARDFTVADSNSEFDTSRASRLPSQSAADDAVNCAAGKPKPTFVVEGDLDALPDLVVVRIKATRTEDNKALFDERVSVPLTAALRALESKPVSATDQPGGQHDPAWIRPGFHVADSGASIPSMDSVGNYAPPRCLECAHAEYPESAMGAKIQGVISLRILIDATGQPAEIVVSKGLPCGLTERAVETVATWRFAPAKGPDGKPAAVWQNVQMSFQLSH
jgi:TonB family protein